jgi:hypothetical protein
MTKILLLEHPKVYSRGHNSRTMSTESSEPSPHLTTCLFRSIIKIIIIIKINFNINLPSIPTFPSRPTFQRYVLPPSSGMMDNYFIRKYIPEDNSELHTHRRENLKSHVSRTFRLVQFSTNFYMTRPLYLPGFDSS